MDQSPPPKIDLNQADAETLAGLPGIGPARAARIVEYRTTVHPFEEAIEIVAVPGISERMYRQFADQVTVAPVEEAEAVAVVESESELVAEEVEPEPASVVEPQPEPEPSAAEPARSEPVPAAVSQPASSSFWRRAISATLLVLAGALLGAVLALLTLQSINGTLALTSHPEVLRLGADLSNLQQQAELRDTELHALRERVNQMEALSGRLQSAETDIQTLETNLATVETQLDTLAGDTAQIKESVDEIEQATQRFGGFLDGLRELLLNIDETPAPTPAGVSPTPTGQPTGTVTVTPTATRTPRPTRTPTPLPE